jgi:hypothetical protein
MSYVVAGLGDLDPRSQMADAEKWLADLLSKTPGAYAAVDAAPVPHYLANAASWKARLKRTPITALLELFQPFDNIAKDIIRESINISGKDSHKIGGVKVSMIVDQAQDNNLDPTNKALTRRLRIIVCYMTLLHQDPRTLVRATTAVANKEGGAAAEKFRNLVAQLPPVPKPPGSLPSLPPPPSLPSSWRTNGLGILPAVAAAAAQAWAAITEAWGTISGIAIAAAPVVVPAIITLILGLTKQASGDIKSQKQAESARIAAQTAGKGEESSSLIPLLALAAGAAFVMTRK